MLEKIIACGRPGAEQAALDAAIKLGIAFGGWLPKGGDPKYTPESDKYNRTELVSVQQVEANKANIRNSDGTLLLSHGVLGFDTHEIENAARRYSTSLLQIDLNQINAFNGAAMINDWIMENRITVLHVSGPSQMEDQNIYQATHDILQAVYFLNLTETSVTLSMESKDPVNVQADNEQLPDTADAAVDLIIEAMSLKDRAQLANFRAEEIAALQLTLGLYIKAKLDFWSGRAGFDRSCETAAEEEKMDTSNLPMVLIKLIWKKLRATHRLRVVK
jgi:hypothetical protein